MKIYDTHFNADLNEIMEELIRQLRLRSIPYLGKIKDGPTDIQVCCPYHNGGMERNPSAGIRKSDGKFHCFACNEIHELPEVISFCFEHYSDYLGKFGWQWLLKNFATVQVEERKDVELDMYRAYSANRICDRNDNLGNADGLFVSEEELDSYRYTHPYMYKRRLTDEIIELFDIGYDRRTKCITFPVRDTKGNCLFIARRSVVTKFFNYPEGVVKPVYGLYELWQQAKVASEYKDGKKIQDYYSRMYFPKEVIICESMLDALTCWVYGKPAVALNGLGNELQFEQLRKLPCRKYILATDNDKAGMKARKRIRDNVKNKLITEYVLPNGKKDINELEKDEFYNLEEIF